VLNMQTNYSNAFPLPNYPPPAYNQNAPLLQSTFPEEQLVHGRRKALFVINLVFLWVLVLLLYGMGSFYLSDNGWNGDAYYVDVNGMRVPVNTNVSLLGSISLYTMGSLLGLWSVFYCTFGSCVMCRCCCCSKIE